VKRFFYRFRGWLVAPPLLFALFSTLGRAHRPVLCWSLGLGLFALGVAVRVWAQQHLHYRLRTPTALTRTGPYARLRNPIYVGNTLVGAGLVACSGLLWLVAPTAVWFLAVYAVVVRYEEGVLAEQYGEPYRRFLAEIPRWMPRKRARVGLQLVNEHLGASLLAELHNLLFLLPFVARGVLLR
jgi:protein-S-isoprenylcysteine O-methyltransferase Ste14